MTQSIGFYLGKIDKLDNAEKIFYINNCIFIYAAVNLRINNIIYNVASKTFNGCTIIELPNELTLNVGDIVELGSFNNDMYNAPILLPKCTKNVNIELEDGTCYYMGNEISVFPHGSWNLKLSRQQPDLFVSPDVFAENLFATLQEFAPENINHYKVDIYYQNELYKSDVKMFTNEQVGIHYYAFLNNMLDDMYYGNIRYICDQNITTGGAYGAYDSATNYNFDFRNDYTYKLHEGYSYITVGQDDSMVFLQYLKYNMNQDIMQHFQSDINTSIKVVPSNSEKILDPNETFINYKKYANTYNYTELQEGIFDNSDIYDKIKNNINWNGFKSIAEYENVPSAVYESISFGQSDNGQYNYPNENLYLLYTSHMVYQEDSTSADATTLYTDVSMIIKLTCAPDSTSYTVQNAFIVPFDFSNTINREVIKISDDNYYYCSSNSNFMIDIINEEIKLQRYTEGNGISESYKYAPSLYKGNTLLYPVPNYSDSTTNYDFFGKAKIIYEYDAIKTIYDGSQIGYGASIITKNNAINDVLFNNDNSILYLQLNKSVQYDNYENPLMLNVQDINTITNQNGTTSLQEDDHSTVRVGNNIYDNIHSVFNKDTIGLLNVNCEFDSTTLTYTSSLNYDVFGDSIFITDIINNNEISDLIDTINENETMYLLMGLDNDIVAGTEFENYPQNISIKISYVNIGGLNIINIVYPERLINYSDKMINKYYRYKQINRFKTDFLNNIYYQIEI